MRVHAVGRHGGLLLPLREEIGDAGLRKCAGSARAFRLWMRAGRFDRKGVSGAQKTGRSSSARNLRFFAFTRLALSCEGRMMAVFRFFGVNSGS